MNTGNAGDRVRVTKYERLGKHKPLVGRTGKLIRTHFAGWYVSFDPVGREKSPPLVLLLNDSDRFEVISCAS